jgi:hypothetical protein
MTAVGRALAAFGRFWWGFLVGDTPELFVAVLVIVGLALAFGHSPSVRGAGTAVVIVAALGLLWLSIWRGRKR